MTSVGLVLGAGGVTGDAFHRGVLRALDEHGWDARNASIIVGTSAGAMVGAFLRRPTDADQPQVLDDESVHGHKLGRLPDLALLRATLRDPLHLRPGPLLASLVPTGRRSTEFLVAGLRRHHGRDWPARPLYVAAVRRSDGRRVAFGTPGAPETDIAHAVAASCAIPGYFHPVEINGEVYVDGGVHSPTNVDLLGDWDLDLLIVSSPMSVDPRRLRPTIDVGIRLGFQRMLRREVAPLRRRGTVVVAFEPGGGLLSTMGINPLRAARIDEVERASAKAAHRLLASRPDVLEVLSGAAERMTSDSSAVAGHSGR